VCCDKSFSSFWFLSVPVNEEFHLIGEWEGHRTVTFRSLRSARISAIVRAGVAVGAIFLILETST
jgi:hypothetical protein